jgi:hypothetical protein
VSTESHKVLRVQLRNQKKSDPPPYGIANLSLIEKDSQRQVTLMADDSEIA